MNESRKRHRLQCSKAAGKSYSTQQRMAHVKKGAEMSELGTIEPLIMTLRNERVILDADLAKVYGVETKRLNEQVKRNVDRFPEDFMFRLTDDEKEDVVANCDHLQKLKFSPQLPYAFTEHGAIMAASVLNSPRAAARSVTLYGHLFRCANDWPKMLRY